ncbi:MAG: BON domain-containing protein [Pirellulaceae bacterium]|nr:BON domain-containing protein [Pirellulaceae bacterium]
MKSDSELKRDVESELQWEPSVDEAHIGISAKDGIVTLTGHVPSFGEKFAAERAAKRVFGVKAVADELDVRLPGSAMRTDEDIARACVSALKNSYSIPDDHIKIVVNNGRVTLDGEVEWKYQRDAAYDAVRYISGVIAVINKLTIKAHASPKDVKNKIVAAFHRSADVDARRIDVETHDGKVTLRGDVRSWAEFEVAQHAAWAAPGVTAVDNKMKINP